MSDPRTVEQLAVRLTKDLVDQGKLLEASWQLYRLLMLKAAFHEPREAEREAFEAGCELVFTSIMNMMEPGTEPTEHDLQRMDSIFREVQAIQQRLQLKYGRSMGNA